MMVSDRFWTKVALDKRGCWNWTGSLNRCGYGKFRYEGAARLTHRVAYQEFVGPIPDGLDLDHLCRNRACCNPKHLEPVTRQENVRRGQGGIHSRLKTHCPRGHAYDETNTRIYQGRRFCRECNRLKNQRQAEEKAMHRAMVKANREVEKLRIELVEARR